MDSKEYLMDKKNLLCKTNSSSYGKSFTADNLITIFYCSDLISVTELAG